jgi:DUF1680 family protein
MLQSDKTVPTRVITMANLATAPLNDSKYSVSPDSLILAKPFPLNRVRLLPSRFLRAMNANADYLLQLDINRLLNRFRLSANLEPKGESYGGWESATIAGHTLGHYLTACAYQYAASGDSRFLDRTNRIVEELKECQNARQDGYVGGVPEGDRVFAEIAKGEIHSKGFDLNGIWVPWYNLHKLFMGLMDAYMWCDNADALDIVSRLGDWAIEVTKNLSLEQWQTMLACEHGGMNEAMAHLYSLTGEERHLELALKFHHKAILDPLERGEKCLPGIHGNTQIPKVIGAAREYELTGEERFQNIAKNFWEMVVHEHTYAIGGNSSGEYFGPAHQLAQRLTMTTAETCNTYNMLKLTKQLFTWEPNTEYSDYYECALMNHILASQDPQTGMMCYFVSLHPGHFKTYSTPFDAFWCCVGTGIENHTRYGEAIYFHDDDGLYVNLFIPSTLDWSEKGVTIEQQTAYPCSNSTRLTVRCEKAVEFDLKIRCPGWAAGDVTAKVGDRLYSSKPGAYLTVDRTWKDGDVVEIAIPLELRVIPTPDNPDRVAIAYGPVVLAGDLGKEGLTEPMPFASDNSAYFGVSTPVVPVMIAKGRPVQEWLKRKDETSLVFETHGVGRPHDVKLVPFYDIVDHRYSIYWDIFNPVGWQNREAKYRAEQERERQLLAMSIDHLAFGEMQPERDHAVEGEKTNPEAHAGHKMRIAWHGGSISCKMKCMARGPVDLVCNYWGQDGRNREFDVYVDGEAIGYQVFTVADHNRFFEVTYPIPTELTQGKTTVDVVFKARDNKIVGPICSCRIISRV